MKAKPEQDLSLLPGEYYHPEAELEVLIYTEEGTIAIKQHRLKGDLHGIVEFYRAEDETLKSRTAYFQGDPHGIAETYWPNGTLYQSFLYIKGNPHGVWKEYREDGTLQLRCHYLQGKKHGTFEWYHEDGTLEKLVFWWQDIKMLEHMFFFALLPFSWSALLPQK